MKLLVALTLVTALSTSVGGIRCYLCATSNDTPCNRTIDCSGIGDHCFKSDILGLVTQGCMRSALCIGPIKCCDTNLCNSAPLALLPVLLLGLTVAISLYLNLD